MTILDQFEGISNDALMNRLGFAAEALKVAQKDFDEASRLISSAQGRIDYYNREIQLIDEAVMRRVRKMKKT